MTKQELENKILNSNEYNIEMELRVRIRPKKEFILTDDEFNYLPDIEQQLKTVFLYHLTELIKKGKI